MRKQIASACALLVLAVAAGPSQAAAQSPADAGAWSPWIGCWHADNTSASEAICIIPDAVGVRMVSIANGAAAEESRVIADGRERDVVQGDCRGTQRATWSADRLRIYLSSELKCGDVERNSSGLLAFADNTHWLSVQAVTTASTVATRTVRYSLTQTTPMPAAVAVALRNAVRSQAVADPVTEAAVSEAARMVDGTAVQEWLQAVGAPYQLADNDSDVAPTTSALEMLAGSAAPVRIVERPVYVRTYVDLHYRYWTPWGYDWWGWHSHRPLIVIRTAPRVVYWPSRTIRHYTSHFAPRYEPPRSRSPVIRTRDTNNDRSHGSRDSRSSTGRTAHAR